MRVLRRLAAALSIGTALVMAAAPAYAVVGGTPADKNSHPYFVRVTATEGGNQVLCGGAWVAPGWVLTLATCTGQPATVTTYTGQTYQAYQAVVHPAHDPSDQFSSHDLGLLAVSAPNWVGQTITVGAPWHPEYYAANQPAKIMGEGLTSAGATSTEQFRVAQTAIRSDSYMSDIFDPWFGFDHWDEPHMIGAGSSAVTLCLGDAGSPLVGGPADAPPRSAYTTSCTTSHRSITGVTTRVLSPNCPPPSWHGWPASSRPS
jgi:hypothetical protein